MEVNSQIVIGILVILVLLLLYAFYYISQQGKKKSSTQAAPELLPKSTVIEAPKKMEPVISTPEVAPSTVIEAPKETEPVDLTPLAVVRSTTVEVPKEVESVDLTPVAVVQSTTVETSVLPESSRVEDVETKQVIRRRRTKTIVKTKNRGSRIQEVEGIGPIYAEKLNSIGVYTTSDLLESGATPLGRKTLSEKTGISPKLILEWVNLSDLFRIKGIGEEYSNLLEEAGVDTVVELSHRNAVNLHAKIVEVNGAKKIVRRPPGVAMVESWVQEAKNLPRKIEY
jgi:predicted flap endonuclease-1-like 5' DNA nuclease